MLRSMAFLRYKRLEYKFLILKQLSISIFLAMGCSVLLHTTHIVSVVLSNQDGSEHNILIFEFIVYSLCLYAVAYIMSPSAISSKLALVNEVVDEGLNELGKVLGQNKRVDSFEFHLEFKRKLRKREEDLRKLVVKSQSDFVEVSMLQMARNKTTIDEESPTKEIDNT